MSGRAGRHIKNKRGLVHLQTYNPENLVLNTIKEMDKEKDISKKPEKTKDIQITEGH